MLYYNYNSWCVQQSVSGGILAGRKQMPLLFWNRSDILVTSYSQNSFIQLGFMLPVTDRILSVFVIFVHFLSFLNKVNFSLNIFTHQNDQIRKFLIRNTKYWKWNLSLISTKFTARQIHCWNIRKLIKNKKNHVICDCMRTVVVLTLMKNSVFTISLYYNMQKICHNTV